MDFLRLNVLTVRGINDKLVAVDGNLLFEETPDMNDIYGCIAILSVDLDHRQRLRRGESQGLADDDGAEARLHWMYYRSRRMCEG